VVGVRLAVGGAVGGVLATGGVIFPLLGPGSPHFSARSVRMLTPRDAAPAPPHA
jgi:hypothetical protein